MNVGVCCLLLHELDTLLGDTNIREGITRALHKRVVADRKAKRTSVPSRDVHIMIYEYDYFLPRPAKAKEPINNIQPLEMILLSWLAFGSRTASGLSTSDELKWSGEQNENQRQRSWRARGGGGGRHSPSLVHFWFFVCVVEF